MSLSRVPLLSSSTAADSGIIAGVTQCLKNDAYCSAIVQAACLSQQLSWLSSLRTLLIELESVPACLDDDNSHWVQRSLLPVGEMQVYHNSLLNFTRTGMFQTVQTQSVNSFDCIHYAVIKPSGSGSYTLGPTDLNKLDRPCNMRFSTKDVPSYYMYNSAAQPSQCKKIKFLKHAEPEG